MALTPYLGEIGICAFNFPPKGWALCNGQFLPINQNQALFSLMGTMYGGNGQTNFALPDLRGRVPIHVGLGFVQGQAGGEEVHTLNLSELPAHTHVEQAVSNNAANVSTPDPTNAYLASANNAYLPAQALTALAPAMTTVGGSQAHTNLQPYSTLSFCVALQGVFPSRN